MTDPRGAGSGTEGKLQTPSAVPALTGPCSHPVGPAASPEPHTLQAGLSLPPSPVSNSRALTSPLPKLYLPFKERPLQGELFPEYLLFKL